MAQYIIIWYYIVLYGITEYYMILRLTCVSLYVTVYHCDLWAVTGILGTGTDGCVSITVYDSLMLHISPYHGLWLSNAAH